MTYSKCWKILPAKNTLSGSHPSIRSRNKGFPRYIKAEFTITRSALQKNAERSSLTWNEKTLISDMKTYKSTQHSGKSKK